MKITYKDFPGYSKRNPQSRIVIDALRDFINSKKQYVSFEFENPSETNYAIHVIFSILQEYNLPKLRVYVNENIIYLSKISDLENELAELLIRKIME